MTNIGQLKERVFLLAFASTQTYTGAAVIAETSREGRWAKVENRTGSSNYNGQQVQFNYDYKITLRHFPSAPVLKTNFIEYKSIKMKIEAIQIVNEGSRRFEVLKCSTIED